MRFGAPEFLFYRICHTNCSETLRETIESSCQLLFSSRCIMSCLIWVFFMYSAFFSVPFLLSASSNSNLIRVHSVSNSRPKFSILEILNFTPVRVGVRRKSYLQAARGFSYLPTVGSCSSRRDSLVNIEPDTLPNKIIKNNSIL